MGRREADARESVDLVEPFEQLHKRGQTAGVDTAAPAVAGYNLAEERDLAHTAIHEAAAFGRNVVHRPGPLVPARPRHDAKRARHVAALLDGDERGDRAPVQHVVADGILGIGFLLNVDDRLPDGNPGVAGRTQVVEVTRNLVELLRADDQIDIRQLVEQCGAAVLRHAAQNTEDEARVVPSPGGRVAGLA